MKERCGRSSSNHSYSLRQKVFSPKWLGISLSLSQKQRANLRQRREAVNKAVNKDEPTKIHGLTVEDYQKVYHSVVDHMLYQSSGQPHQYSVALGRKIKERLWEELFCPGVREVAKPGGRVLVEEMLSIPGQNSCPPMIEVDISGEPVPLIKTPQR